MKHIKTKSLKFSFSLVLLFAINLTVLFAQNKEEKKKSQYSEYQKIKMESRIKTGQEQVKKLYDAGQYEKAEKYCANKKENQATCYNELADLYYKDANYKKAAEFYKKSGYSTVGLLSVSGAYFNMKDYESASEYFVEAGSRKGHYFNQYVANDFRKKDINEMESIMDEVLLNEKVDTSFKQMLINNTYNKELLIRYTEKEKFKDYFNDFIKSLNSKDNFWYTVLPDKKLVDLKICRQMLRKCEEIRTEEEMKKYEKYLSAAKEYESMALRYKSYTIQNKEFLEELEKVEVEIEKIMQAYGITAPEREPKPDYDYYVNRSKEYYKKANELKAAMKRLLSEVMFLYNIMESENMKDIISYVLINEYNIKCDNNISHPAICDDNICPAVKAGGQVYLTVKIGDQVWMDENLNVACYRNGDSIPQVRDKTQWENTRSGACCYYQNNTEKGRIYGKLYNWYAVNDPRGLVPEGWHIPSDDEWKEVEAFLGMDSASLDKEGYGQRGEAGGYLKETGKVHWDSPNKGATNIVGFTALPAGWRTYYGQYSDLEETGKWWTKTEADAKTCWFRELSYDNTSIKRSHCTKATGLSVRCIKD